MVRLSMSEDGVAIVLLSCSFLLAAGTNLGFCNIDRSFHFLDNQVIVPSGGKNLSDKEAIVKIVTIAGAGWYYHLVTPFAYG